MVAMPVPPQGSGSLKDGDDIAHSLLSAGLEVVRLPERSMAGLVADLLQPGVGDAGTQRD